MPGDIEVITRLQRLQEVTKSYNYTTLGKLSLNITPNPRESKKKPALRIIEMQKLESVGLFTANMEREQGLHQPETG